MTPKIKVPRISKDETTGLDGAAEDDSSMSGVNESFTMIEPTAVTESQVESALAAGATAMVPLSLLLWLLLRSRQTVP